jgi:D-alanyl-lipoteichoic acid acyltransferase DltB (MBOAT superfamily)
VLFNSYEFIFLFLPVAVLGHFAVAVLGGTAAAGWTAALSLAFYAWWNPPYVGLIAGSILANFALARAILSGGQALARGALIAGIAGNLAVLAYYKYAGFLASMVVADAAAPAFVPLALSFTTFVQIAFLVDLWRRRGAAPPFGDYAMFVTFFPHLIAGPIVRWGELGPQIADGRMRRVDWANVAMGLTMFAIGLAKKVLLADPIAVHVAPVFDAAAAGEPLTAAAAWGGAVAFGMQLYFDFSGYSDMAVGLALLLNLRLPVNFASPYRAASIIEFWRRWHISLSRFLRDYLYIPLGGNRRGAARRYVNLMVVMTLGGLWHGAGWTFVAWGALHGAFLLVNHAWRAVRGERAPSRAGRLAAWALTFAAVSVAWVFFRATDLDAACAVIAAMAWGTTAPAPEQLALPWDDHLVRSGLVSEAWLREWLGAAWSVRATLWTIGLAAIAVLLPDTAALVGYRADAAAAPPAWLRWRPSTPWLAATLALFLVTLTQVTRVSEFLYFQF